MHDEKLVLHVREGFVVDDLLDETPLGLGGDTLNGSCPCVQRCGVKGVWEEMWALVAAPGQAVADHPLC